MERRELGARCPQSQRWIPALVCRRSGQGGSTGAEVVVNTTSDLRMGDTEHNTHFIQARFDEVRIAKCGQVQRLDQGLL